MARRANVVELGERRARSAAGARAATGGPKSTRLTRRKPSVLESLSIGRLEEPGPSTGTRAQYRARLLSGSIVSVELDRSFEPALAAECCETGQPVILARRSEGEPLLVVGALQTSRGLTRQAEGQVTLAGRRIELDAEEGIVLRAGKSALRLDRTGTLKVVGERMTMDVATVVRILASLVELP
jgi:hypothetical protein